MKIVRIAKHLNKLKGTKIPSANKVSKIRNKSEVFWDFINTIDENSTSINKNAKAVAEGISAGKKTFKNNRSIVQFLKTFIQTVEPEVLVEIFMLFGSFILTGLNSYRSMRMMNENDPIDRFIPLSECSNVINTSTAQKLFESQQLLADDFEDVKDINIKGVLDNTDKQFKFESGHYMEALNSDKLSDIKFSLRWHKDNTSNFDEFLESVSNFLATTETELTDVDIKKLKFHYSKHA